MEYHYQDICMPTDHLLADPYTADYSNAYTMPGQSDAEYGVRSTVVVDGGDRYGVSAVVFDKHEELVWMGNQGGHVTSYYGPSMQKYTSFQVHETDEIRDIITDENGIYVLTKTSIRHQIRRGIPKYTHRSPNMKDMQCLFQASPIKLLMGGHQEKLLELDLNKMTETVFPLPGEDSSAVVLRSGGGSTVACGSANGTVTLCDIRSPATVVHTFHAHTACLSDLDMQGNLLITCGFTYGSSGTAEAEPYVVTWDVRRLRGGISDGGAWTSATHSPPLLLHFVPAFSGRAVAVSGDGHVALLHVNVANDVENQSVFQVDTQSSSCSVMDVSASSQAFVFGDNGGHLHLFSPQHNHEPVFNNFSRETEFADPHPNIPFSSFADTSFQYSSVPLPPLTTGNKWFNVLPESFFKKVYRKTKPIDPEVLKTMKMQGPIGYAPNPKTHRRNQMPFKEDTLEDLKSPRHNEVKNIGQPIPKHYQKMDPRFKHAQTEVDYDNCNHTGLPGLDGAMTNSYCNPMLQVLYYTAPLKATLLAHTCAKEFCLSCELGFLFRMLSTSGGASCQAANFLRAFRTVPEAAALGLVLPDRRTKPDDKLDMVLLIQSWNRFILHQMHYEILETRKKEKELARLTTANSPPTTRAGNVATTAGNVTTTRDLDRKFDEYNFYNELEFLGPSQFSPEGKEDGWPVNNGQEDGAPTNEPQSRESDEIQSSQHDQEESEISELFAIRRHQLNRCLKCNKEEERDSVVLACALQHPAPRAAPPPPSLARLLRSSLSARRSSPAWCDACARFTPQQLSELLTRLPPILAVNCGGSAALELYWSKGTNKDTEAAKRSIGKPCRWGVFCQRAGCRFKHPEGDDEDNPYIARASSSSKCTTPENDCVLPVQLVIKLTSDGDIVINDEVEPQSDTNQSPSKSDSNSQKHKKHSFTETQEQYTLTAAVVCVEDNPKNLVAYVKTPASDGEPQWHLFNDLCIVPVSVEEVVQCNASWKTPCVLFYTSRSAQSVPRPGVRSDAS